MEYDIPLPSNKNYEEFIIYKLIADSNTTQSEKEKIVNQMIDADFFHIEYLEIFKVYKHNFFKKKKSLDSDTLISILQERFRKQGIDKDVYTLVTKMYTLEIDDPGISLWYLNDIIIKTKELTVKRRLLMRLEEMKKELYDAEMSLGECIEKSYIIFKKASLYLDNFISKNNTIDSIKSGKIQLGLRSGFITHDWNDSGLKAGKVTLLLGSRGHGKTTIARQMAMAVVLQKRPIFFFSGEESKENEKNNMARILAHENELEIIENDAGRNIYYPSQNVIDKFSEKLGKYITIEDTESYPIGEIFQYMMIQMEQLARKGYFLFVIDNMMIINEAIGNKRFIQQKEIVKTLKEFAKKYDVHVILIAHPRKGVGDQTTSGVAEQENLVDTIIRYKRIIPDDKDCSKLIKQCKLPEKYKSQVTAVLIPEKVRDNGKYEIAWLKWDGIKGIVLDMSMLPRAHDYAQKAGWVLPVHKYEV